MTLQGSQMEADDPITSYMLQVCCSLNTIAILCHHYFASVLLILIAFSRHGRDCVNALVRTSYHT